jgi:hypothetical protein
VIIEKVHVKANPNIDLSGWTIEEKQETVEYVGPELYRLMVPLHRRLWYSMKNWFMR